MGGVGGGLKLLASLFILTEELSSSLSSAIKVIKPHIITPDKK